VGVTLDDFAPGAKCGVVKGIRKLAEAAADAGDDAALAQLPPKGELTKSRRLGDMGPEAEHLAARDHHAVKMSRGDTKVLDFAGLEGELGGVLAGVKRSYGFGKTDGAGAGRGRKKTARAARTGIAPCAPDLKGASLEEEEASVPMRGRGEPFHGGRVGRHEA